MLNILSLNVNAVEIPPIAITAFYIQVEWVETVIVFAGVGSADIGWGLW